MGTSSMEWHVMQCFGERLPGEEVKDVDIISAMEFDAGGNNFAAGDHGGRVVLFEKGERKPKAVGPDSRPSGRAEPNFEYRYLTEFQSHVPEFDYLRSLEILGKINKVRWCEPNNRSRLLLSTNDKTVKLWRICERKVRHLSDFNVKNVKGVEGLIGSVPRKSAEGKEGRGLDHPSQLRLPRVVGTESVLSSCCLRSYANAHVYHINSVSLNSDQATFLSADDLRVHLWNLEVSDTSFNMVDMKPNNMEDLEEVITCADFHPHHCNIFTFASSKGIIRLADMRKSARCESYEQVMGIKLNPEGKSFFSEMISSISDLKFSADGRYILVRDYMTLRLWDMHMTTAPVATYNVHEQLRSGLCQLFENDAIFDKFTCCFSPDGQHVATGTYNNLFRVFGRGDGTNMWQESSWESQAQVGDAVEGKTGKSVCPANGLAVDNLNSSSKILHLSWHPSQPVMAVGACTSLYLFYTS
ncbi:unnamed protein product [Ostreobium quekettii]|uniref:Serine/threonine-protein phosphatase 2A 55 kDa regulatory subunit B n=1 Tax=Ostreobium quekettii TaxID=121088 RepID=A0A8S1IK95_9CHLO|nr:unnamed protein product [Ostreobium quekettii]|eukprot:evm.model.scf_337.6 EVM.evm.TU.scf_337.6   scf_337:39228-40637(-)